MNVTVSVAFLSENDSGDQRTLKIMSLMPWILVA